MKQNPNTDGSAETKKALALLRSNTGGVIIMILFCALSAGASLFLSDRLARQEQALEERIGQVELGIRMEDFKEEADKPDAVCRQQEVKGHFGDIGNGETDKIWIYRVRPEKSTGCHFDYRDALIGFDYQGVIVWFNRSFGEEETITAYEEN